MPLIALHIIEGKLSKRHGLRGSYNYLVSVTALHVIASLLEGLLYRLLGAHAVAGIA